MSLFLFLPLFFLLLLLQGFFSGSEMSLISVSPLKARHQAAKGWRPALLVEGFQKSPGQFLATTLVGTNLAVIANSALLTWVFSTTWGDRAGYLAALFLIPFSLVFGEAIPKVFFQQNAETWAFRVAFPLALCRWLLAPLTYTVTRIAQLLLPPTGRSPESLFISREGIRLLLQKDEEAAKLESEEKKMIHKIIDFGDTTVREAMIPLIEVVALPKEATVEGAIAIVAEHHFSRIPVYEGRIDNIIGIVHAFDLFFSREKGEDLASLIRPAFYVPEIKRADDLLRDFQREQAQMAIVVDEYGGVEGIVTVEDLLEEIVGEIEDEYDESAPPLWRLPDGSYLVDARVEVDRLNEELGLDIPKGEYETLGGFLLFLLQRIPRAGEEAHYGSLRFLITEADRKSILRVKVKPSVPKAEVDQGRDS